MGVWPLGIREAMDAEVGGRLGPTITPGMLVAPWGVYGAGELRESSPGPIPVKAASSDS